MLTGHGFGVTYTADRAGADAIYLPSDMAAGVLALANAALPADSPHKLTGDDLANLHRATGILAASIDPEARHASAAVVLLAAKLRALLSPV